MPATTIQPVLALDQLIAGVRAVNAERGDWSTTAQRVTDQLHAHLPGPDILAAEQRLGSPDRAESHTRHVESDGSFSVTAVWRPGQMTRTRDRLKRPPLLRPRGRAMSAHATVASEAERGTVAELAGGHP